MPGLTVLYDGDWLVMVEDVLLLLEDAVLLCQGGQLLQPLLQQHGSHGHLPGVRGHSDLTAAGQTGRSCCLPWPPGLLTGEHPHQAAAPTPQSHVQAGGERYDGGGGG